MFRSPPKTELTVTLLAVVGALLQPVGCGDERVCVMHSNDASLPCEYDVTPRREVDILFVIDDSGSMGEEQAILSANFDRFIDKLERFNADYRIAITTTNVGNPLYCPSGAEDGALLLSTCHDRAVRFVHDGLDLDKFDEACAQYCPAEFAGATTLPTTTDYSDEELSRPWIEPGNLPEGMDGAQAFQCFGPQGINGCGYNESPLEAMNRALEHAEDPNDEAYGFIRDDALLAVVLITDENDCSVAPDSFDIFDRNGSRVFWENADLAGPTSAVCWNAGTQCDASGENCRSANYLPDGSKAEDPFESVLHPLDRYRDKLALIKGTDRADDVLVSLIAGVPEDYPETPIPYGPAADQETQDLFGTAPGCTSESGTATPPARLRDFALEYAGEAESNLFSICSDDYSPALEELSNRIIDKFGPACMSACVADMNPESDGLQTSCDLFETAEGQEPTRLTKCDATADGWVHPGGTTACYYELTPADDEFHDMCRTTGGNLEFKVMRATGELAPSGSRIVASCELSDTPHKDCPELVNELSCHQGPNARPEC